jgi:hypothetical protein
MPSVPKHLAGIYYLYQNIWLVYTICTKTFGCYILSVPKQWAATCPLYQNSGLLHALCTKTVGVLCLIINNAIYLNEFRRSHCMCETVDIATSSIAKCSCHQVVTNFLLFSVFYKVVQIWPGLIVCKQVTVYPGYIWTTLYLCPVWCLSREPPQRYPYLQESILLSDCLVISVLFTNCVHVVISDHSSVLIPVRFCALCAPLSGTLRLFFTLPSACAH